MNRRNSLAMSQRSRWAVRLTVGGMLASMLLSSIFNVLVAWHLHTLTSAAEAGTRHVEMAHRQAAPEAQFVLSDVVERMCDATKQCPCVPVWALGDTQAWLAKLDLGWFALSPPVAFQSYLMDVPQHPPNSDTAVWG